VCIGLSLAAHYKGKLVLKEFEATDAYNKMLDLHKRVSLLYIYVCHFNQ
jgi:hypothetical protein